MTKAETLFCSSLFVFSFVIIIDVKKGCWKTFKQLIPLQRNTLVVTLYIRRYALLVTMLHSSFICDQCIFYGFIVDFRLREAQLKWVRNQKRREEKKTHTNYPPWHQCRIFDSSIFHGCGCRLFHILLRFFLLLQSFFLSRISITCDFVILLIKHERAHNLCFINLLFSKHNLWYFGSDVTALFESSHQLLKTQFPFKIEQEEGWYRFYTAFSLSGHISFYNSLPAKL